MTKKEEIYLFIKKHKKVKGTDVWKLWGANGSTKYRIANLELSGKIHSRFCECGRSKFYEISKRK